MPIRTLDPPKRNQQSMKHLTMARIALETKSFKVFSPEK